MTDLRKQEKEKISTEGEENMTDLSNDFKPTNVNNKNIDDTGNETCGHCRGTGVNPKYEKVNKIINAILDYTYRKKRTFYSPTKSDVPFCIYCLGEGTIYRNQNNNKKDKKEILANMQLQYKKTFSKSYSDIGIFLIYVANCETIYDCDKETAMHYDIVDDSWKEYNGSYNIQEAKLNLINCMRDFLADGYLDKKFNRSAESYFQGKNVFKRWIGLETRTNLDICWCCHRHYTALKRRFWVPGDPKHGDFTGPYTIDFFRPPFQVDQKAVKAGEEAYKRNKNDIDATKKWLIKKYGNEIAEEIIFAFEAQGCNSTKTWECRDCCLNISDDEYFENQMSLYLDKEGIEMEKKMQKKLSRVLKNVYIEEKNEDNGYIEEKNGDICFSFKDIKF